MKTSMSDSGETREGFYLSEDGEWIPEGWILENVENALAFGTKYWTCCM